SRRCRCSSPRREAARSRWASKSRPARSRKGRTRTSSSSAPIPRGTSRTSGRSASSCAPALCGRSPSCTPPRRAKTRIGSVPDGAARVAIVGAGPTGIACAAELARRRIESVCYEKGFLLDSLYHFPEEMRWFSTRDLLDIAGVPFASPEPHPTRLESLASYGSVADRFGVAVEPETEVRAIHPRAGGGVEVELASKGKVEKRAAAAAILATGFFGNPRRLGVPGEDRPIVHRRYVSGY